MIVPVMAISNLVLTQQIYSEETNGAHAHYREPVPLNECIRRYFFPLSRRRNKEAKKNRLISGYVLVTTCNVSLGYLWTSHWWLEGPAPTMK